jgi:hypothetical protein
MFQRSSHRLALLIACTMFRASTLQTATVDQPVLAAASPLHVPTARLASAETTPPVARRVDWAEIF